jgi:hypothetical protein
MLIGRRAHVPVVPPVRTMHDGLVVEGRDLLDCVCGEQG